MPIADGLQVIKGGAAFFVRYGVTDDPPWQYGAVAEHWLWEGDNWIREQVLPYVPNREVFFGCSALDSSGHEYLVVLREFRIGDPPQRAFRGDLVQFCTRLDPRIGP
jgi:hypothetical protein